MKTSINLLPATYRQQMLLKRILRQWLVIGLILCLFLTGASLIVYGRLRDSQLQHQQLETRAEPHRQLLKENVQLENDLKTLQQKQSAIKLIANAKVHLQTLGMISQNASQLGDKLQILDFTLDKKPAPTLSRKENTKTPSSTAVNTPLEPTMSLRLQGLTEDETTVAGFIKILENNEELQSVNLKSIRRKEYYNRVMQVFEIECLL